MDIRAQFGATLRTLREERGLTQEALAHAADVHPVEISRMEAGRRDVKLSTLVRLASALDVDVGRLVSRDHESDAG